MRCKLVLYLIKNLQILTSASVFLYMLPSELVRAVALHVEDLSYVELAELDRTTLLLAADESQDSAGCISVPGILE